MLRIASRDREGTVGIRRSAGEYRWNADVAAKDFDRLARS
jgi:hypothetical protein